MIGYFWEKMVIELPLYTLVIEDEERYRFIERNYLYFRYFCPN